MQSFTEEMVEMAEQGLVEIVESSEPCVCACHAVSCDCPCHNVLVACDCCADGGWVRTSLDCVCELF